MFNLRLARIYQDIDKQDGVGVLVDGLWPRGICKDSPDIDVWLKEIAPSAELRKWFNHEPGKWDVFCQRYHKELDQNQEPVQKLQDMLKEHDVILLYAAKNENHNNAVALKAYLESTLH